MNSIFAVIRQATGGKPILVLDQIVNDWEFETKRYSEYIPNLKIIAVYRDPRDVYTFAKLANVQWIPHKSVDVFVKWYQILIRHFNVNEQNVYLSISFESLICQYDEMVGMVEQFLGLRHASHTKRGMCLDISSSRKNIGVWRKRDDLCKCYETISHELTSLCYND